MSSVNDDKKGKSTFNTNSLRNTMTSKEGHIPARILQCKVINLNLVNYTVDVVSLFDRHRYYNIQIASPYLHYANGEGFTCYPEVGASCVVCLSSDSTPPFVLAFVMPFQKIDDASTPDAPQGTASHGGTVPNPSAATFAGGRPLPKPGDIFCRGRDGQFIILHRGGVLQIGASELAQRIFIPLDNRVIDISESYAHHNVGGSVVWGIAPGSDTSVSNTETYRVFANDKHADVRITKGNVRSPLSGAGGTSGVVVYEVAISPKGFNADSGDTTGSGGLVYHFAVDRTGNVTTQISGSLSGRVTKAVNLKFDKDLSVTVGTSASITAKDGMDLNGGAYTHVKGDIVRLGKGDQAVARKGDFVSTKVMLPAKAMIVFPAMPATSGPCTISFLDSLGGVVTSGNEKVRA